MSTLSFDPHAVPVRPAATVMLVRDTDDGMEVFMLRRTASAAFAAGMYVFPGGRVDEADGVGMETWCDGRTDAEASRLLRIPSGGLAYWVAAIRECFEEAGVLLARHAATGEVVSFTDPVRQQRFAQHRHAVHEARLGLAELCRDEGLRLTAGDIGYVSHWITPLGEVRRFDARFFVARAPHGQEPLHDSHETVDSLWVRPAVALERFAQGTLGMFPPTVSNLEFLSRYATADEALAATVQVGSEVPTILPKVRVDADGRVVALLLPGADGYDDAPDYEVVETAV